MSEVTADVQLQEFLEGGGDLPVDPLLCSPQEVRAYQLIFEELQFEPDAPVPPEFAVRVLRRVKRTIRMQRFIFSLWIALFAVVGTALVYILFELADKNSAKIYGAFIGHYKWVFVYIILFVLAIQYLDPKFSKGREVRFSG